MIGQLQETVQFRGTAFSLEKRYDIGNSSRILPPEQTLHKVKPYFSRIGLTRIANITGLDRVGLPVAISIRPNSYSLTQSSGKGISLEAALASAAMESIELYCAENIRQDRILGTYDKLRRDMAVVDVDDLYLSRYSLFRIDRPEEWLLGWDIIQQEEVAVPYHSVTLDFRVLNDLRCPASFTIDSNGLASGNHFLEALLAGLYEVIERDGVSCHTEAERYGWKKQRISLSDIDDETVQGVYGTLVAKGLVPVVLDCTSDIGVPVFEAYLYDAESNAVPISHGYGAHLDPATAITRALTEAVQARTLIVSGSRDDLFRDLYNAHRIRHRSMVSLVERNHADIPMRWKDQSSSSFEADILTILAMLQKARLKRVVVFDLSPGDVDISVVRVVVPGLEGYHFYGYNPRRRAKEFIAALRRRPDQLPGLTREVYQESTHLPAGGIL